MYWIIVILSGLLIIAGLFILLIHLGFRAPRRPETGTPAAFGLPYTQVSIPTVAGKRLFGWWLAADSVESNSVDPADITVTDTTIIIMHGWGGNAELMLPLAVPLYTQGLNVLLFDARNHGRSDGHSFSSLPRFAEDLEHALDWLQQHYPAQSQRIVLLGHSLGAGAVLLAASRRKDIAALISIAAFAHPKWVMRRYLSWLPNGLVVLINQYVQWLIGHRFDDIAPVNTICHINCPVLLVHGLADEMVPVSDAHAIAGACPRDNLQLLEIPGAGHESVDKIEQHEGELLAFLLRLSR